MTTTYVPTTVIVVMDNGDRFSRKLTLPLADAQIGDVVSLDIGECTITSRRWDSLTGNLNIVVQPGVLVDLEGKLNWSVERAPVPV